jgi:esterase
MMSVPIYHRQMGVADGYPLVAIHGLFGSLENLGVVTRKLSDEYCVYALDLPNHGRSEHTATINLLSMADAVVAWMDRVGIARAHFLGHSLGGKVGMEIALRYPDRVNQLVVADISPVAYSRRHQDVFDAFHAVDLSALTSRTDADKDMQPHVSELSTRSFLLKNLEKNDQGWFWRMNLEGLIAAYDELISANASGFPCFKGGVLFIKGGNSPYILPEHRDAILSLFPEASVKVINETHHWLHAEKPDIFVGIVRRFLAPV